MSRQLAALLILAGCAGMADLPDGGAGGGHHGAGGGSEATGGGSAATSGGSAATGGGTGATGGGTSAMGGGTSAMGGGTGAMGGSTGAMGGGTGATGGGTGAMGGGTGATGGGTGAMGGGAGGGTTMDLCAGLPLVNMQSVTWGDYSRLTTPTWGGFGPTTVFVMSMTIPSTPASYAYVGYTSVFEWQGPPTLRELTLSTVPCDFRNVGPIAAGSGTTPIIYWNVGSGSGDLTPGQTYYFSYRNQAGACPQSSCDAAISTIWPH